ncbi:unnamed protein product [Cylicostephanus goldi]|uniref:Receptor ligand binding region domain-containing protein n=1 Tax=Cylicostephanus goldi TaxID=71465 RepID=A0A3P6RHK9_CYLGO|nr:unnamed protein product [Cylicostephanus goldi]
MSGNCSDIVAGGVAAELILKYNVAAIIGPACIEEIKSVAPLSTYYNVPTFAWGLATSSLSEEERYSSVMTVRSTGQDFAAALMDIINHFKWEQFATIYYGDECADFHEELVVSCLGSISAIQSSTKKNNSLILVG